MKNKKWCDHALMINRDPNWYNCIEDDSKENCIKSLEDYFSFYDGSITDICLGLLEQTTIVPSKHLMWRGEKYLQKLENGIPVDYSGNGGLRALYNCYEKFGVDGVQIFIDQMNKKGIRPWLALRMNDSHFSDKETAFLRSDFFYEAKREGYTVGEQYGVYCNCLDFQHKRYTDALLGFIGELVDKYDFFGLELDFMRSIVCLDYKNDPECHKIMTEFVRKVRARVTEAEKRVGHDIKISIRTSRSPVDAMCYGFDIKTMMDEGLIDVVVPTPRWSPTDSGIPVAQWRELLGDDAIIIAGIETNNFKSTTNTPEHSKAYTAAFYAEGADGIYYNNHEYDRPRNHASWAVNYKNCLEGLRDFTVTYQDCEFKGNVVYKPVPLAVEGEADLPLNVGPIKATDDVKVIVDFEGDAIPTLSVGEKTDVNAEHIDHVIVKKNNGEDFDVTPNNPLMYNVNGISTDSPITLTFKGNGTVNFIKILIDAK